MAKINAQKILISSGSTPLGFQSNGTLNIESETIDVTTKDDSEWGSVIPGVKSWSIDVDGLMSYTGTDADNGGQTLAEAIIDGTLLTVSWETATTGDITFSGEVYVSSLSLGGNNNEGATWNGSMQGVGAIVKGVKA